IEPQFPILAYAAFDFPGEFGFWTGGLVPPRPGQMPVIHVCTEGDRDGALLTVGEMNDVVADRSPGRVGSDPTHAVQEMNLSGALGDFDPFDVARITQSQVRSFGVRAGQMNDAANVELHAGELLQPTRQLREAFAGVGGKPSQRVN